MQAEETFMAVDEDPMNKKKHYKDFIYLFYFTDFLVIHRVDRDDKAHNDLPTRESWICQKLPEIYTKPRENNTLSL